MHLVLCLITFDHYPQTPDDSIQNKLLYISSSCSSLKFSNSHKNPIRNSNRLPFCRSPQGSSRSFACPNFILWNIVLDNPKSAFSEPVSSVCTTASFTTVSSSILHAAILKMYMPSNQSVYGKLRKNQSISTIQ